MSHSQNSMGYMVVLCIILYIVGVSIYLFVKFVRKKLDEARDRRFQREHQADMMAEAAKEKPDENRETDGKCIQAPSFFVFLVTFSTRKKVSFG